MFHIFYGPDNAGPTKNCACFVAGFFFPLYFVYPINVKNKPSFSMSDGMLVVSAIFLAGEDLELKLVLQSKTFMQNIDDE